MAFKHNLCLENNFERLSLDENKNSPPKKRLKTEGRENLAARNCSVRDNADQVMKSAGMRESLLRNPLFRNENNSKKNKSRWVDSLIGEPGGLRTHLLTGVKVLSTRKIVKISSPAFTKSQCPETYSLHTLNLNRIKITAADLGELLSRCPRLRALLLDIDPSNRDLCQIIGEKLPNLATLTVKLFGNVCESLKLILRGCQRLTSLHLKQCCSHSAPLDIVHEFPSSILNLKAVHWTLISSDLDLDKIQIPQLINASLHVEKLHLPTTATTCIVLSNVKLLVSKCPNVTYLAINLGPHTFTEESLISLSQLRKLKVLDLGYGANLQPLALCLLKKIRSLKTLQLFGPEIPYEKIMQICRSLPGVTVNRRKKKSNTNFKMAIDQNGSENIGKANQQDKNVKMETTKFEIKMEELEENSSEKKQNVKLDIGKFEIKKEEPEQNRLAKKENVKSDIGKFKIKKEESEQNRFVKEEDTKFDFGKFKIKKEDPERNSFVKKDDIKFDIGNFKIKKEESEQNRLVKKQDFNFDIGKFEIKKEGSEPNRLVKKENF